MPGELISKKELLELTGISYGQLYRWKRKNLIPEDWFIKKSTFTGQETFFDKDKILERIDKIKSMKDDMDLSLDDIADMFSPQLANIILKKEELIQKNIVSQMSLNIYKSFHNDIEVFTFEKILNIAILEKFLESGSISLDEGKVILQCIEENYSKFKDKQCQAIFLRKFGVGICILTAVPNEIYFDNATNVAAKVNITEIIEMLKSKITIK